MLVNLKGWRVHTTDTSHLWCEFSKEDSSKIQNYTQFLWEVYQYAREHLTDKKEEILW